MDQKKDEEKGPSSTPDPTAITRETATPSPEAAESPTSPQSEDNKETASSAEKAEDAPAGETNMVTPGANTTLAAEGQPPSEYHQTPLETSPPFLDTGPPTTETACGPGDSSIRVDMLGSDSDDITGIMNRLSRVSRVLMPIQQIADASTQMYPSLFHPIGASGVIIYSDGSSTDVSGLTIPYFDPLREIAAGLMSVSDPGGEQFEWNSLLESDPSSNMSRPPGHIGDDYYIATYVDPEENSNVLFTSMNPVTEVPYTTLEVLDGMEIDSTRGIVISARPPEGATAPPIGRNASGENATDPISMVSRDEVNARNTNGNMPTTTMPHLGSNETSQSKTGVTSVPDPESAPSEIPVAAPSQVDPIPTRDPAPTNLQPPQSVQEAVPEHATADATSEQDSAKSPSQQVDSNKKE